MCLNKSIGLPLRTLSVSSEGLLTYNFMMYSAPNLYWEVHQENTLLEFMCFINTLLTYALPAPGDMCVYMYIYAHGYIHIHVPMYTLKILRLQ